MRHVWMQFCAWTQAHTPEVWHPSKKRLHHALGMFIGLALVLAGPFLEHTLDPGVAMVADLTGVTVPHTLWSSVAWGLHALGMVPLIMHSEKFWDLLLAREPSEEQIVYHPRKKRRRR